MSGQKRDIAAILKGAAEYQGVKKAAVDGSDKNGTPNNPGTAASSSTNTAPPTRSVTPPPKPTEQQVSPLRKRVPPAIPQPRIVRPAGYKEPEAASSTATTAASSIPVSRIQVTPPVAPPASSRQNNNETPLETSIQQARENIKRAEAAAVAEPTAPVVSRQRRIPAILVNKNQRGNKVLDFIKDVPWEYGAGDMVADYVTGSTSCVLFLSIKYHSIKPEYIYRKIAKLQKQQFDLKVLLVLIDKENHEAAIRELTRASMRHDLAILVAWSNEDCGNYISKLKSLETATVKLIEGSKSKDYTSRLADVLSNVKLNKTDALNISTTFKSLKNAILDDSEKVAEINGFGSIKVKRWIKTTRDPFIYKPTAE
ncbi:Mating-type switching protein [Yarrowia sp. C11]|nr:Mating-type switching protein [Yarrowia sp. E02]KAG5367818.1 Mating-type switching protein [Yarrowia sp. C11]